MTCLYEGGFLPSFFFKGGILNVKASKDYIFIIIDEMTKEYYSPPTTYNIRSDIFMYRSYSHWAIKELREYLISRIDEDPICVVEEFRYKMDFYSCHTKNKNSDIMFSIGYDVATDILDVLLNSHKKRSL